MTAVEFHRLNPTRDSHEIESRARCQDDGHPVGAVHPYWFGHNQPGYGPRPGSTRGTVADD